MPKIIFIGIDASGSKGFNLKDIKAIDLFTLAAVTCSDFREAEKAVEEIDSRWPPINGKKRKGKDLHKCWKEVLEVLKKYDLRYYVFAHSKKQVQQLIVQNYKSFNFEGQSKKYHIAHDRYAKHGWLTIETLKKFGYKGITEVKVDKDLQGDGWEDYKKQVKINAENHVGYCCIMDSDDSYPLIRIADIIANFSYNQLKRQPLLTLDNLEIIKQLRKDTATMRLVTKIEKIDYTKGQISISLIMEEGIPIDFVPYSYWLFNGRIIVQKLILHIKSLFRAI